MGIFNVIPSKKHPTKTPYFFKHLQILSHQMLNTIKKLDISEQN